MSTVAGPAVAAAVAYAGGQPDIDQQHVGKRTPAYPPADADPGLLLGHLGSARHSERSGARISGATSMGALAQTVAVEGALADRVAGALGAPVVNVARVHGGDVAIAFGLDLADGRRVFVKTHRAPPPGFFTTEAAGLSWLAAADAVDVPAVLAVSDGPPAFLALSWIEPGQATADDRCRPRPPARRPAPRGHAVLRAPGSAHDRQPGAAQRAGRDVERVLRRQPAAAARSTRPRQATRSARRRSTVWLLSPVASTRSAGRPSRRPACTATCGRATASSAPVGGAGSSIRRPTAVTASSTWR